MKEKEIQFLYQLDKETLPVLTAQIRVNPLKTEVLCFTHRNVLSYLTDTFGIDEKIVDNLARNYLEEPLEQLNEELKKLIENHSVTDDPKTSKEVMA